MFKNVTVYRIDKAWSVSAAQLQTKLEASRFVACGATQEQSLGWVAPRGVRHGPLLEAVAGQWILKLTIEKKVLPTSVVKRRVDELLQEIEDATAHKPGKKQARQIADEVRLDLLPRAFTKQDAVPVWIDPAARLLVVGTASQSKADSVVSALVQSLDGLPIALLQTTASPSVSMSAWLSNGEAPAGFSIDGDCELKSTDETKAAVKYSRHLLDTAEVRQHVADGKLPTHLALTWSGRVSFTLTQSLQLKKLAFLDGVFESGPSAHDDAFDTDAVIATGELGKLMADLIEALGGEAPEGAIAREA